MQRRVRLVAVGGSLITAGVLAAVVVPPLFESSSIPHANASAVRQPTNPGYVAVAPQHVVDTALGTGHRGPLRAGVGARVVLRGLPADASSVALEVTVSSASTAGTLTVAPGPGSTAASGAVAYGGAPSTTTLVQTGVGTDRSITLLASAGSVAVSADLVGYYAVRPTSGGGFVPVARGRLASATVSPAAPAMLPVAGVAGVPEHGVVAVALDITADAATGVGSLTAAASGSAAGIPVASYAPGLPTSQLAFVRPGPRGVVLTATAGSVDVRVAVVGYFALPPGPASSGTLRTVADGHPVDLDSAPGATTALTVLGVDGVPRIDVSAVALQVTLTPREPGNATVALAPVDDRRFGPRSAGQLRTARGLPTTQLVLVAPGADGRIAVSAGGTARVAERVQVVGYYQRRDWVVLENAARGTTAWRLHGKASSTIEGYADRVSAAPGEVVHLYVHSPKPWTVQAFRLGWYGGTGGRLVWTSSTRPAQPQPAAAITRATRTVRAPWRVSLGVSTASWPPGMYLLKLRMAGGQASEIPMLVRSPSVAERTVFMTSDMTLQAYNDWGRHSLYVGPKGRPATRSYAVSFDRPYDPTIIYRVLDTEQPLVFEAERLGLPLAYLSDVDVASRPAALDGARTLVVGGHDEYWTWSERAAVLAARDRGTNLLFFGANQLWWQVRLGATPLGDDRLETGYKTSVNLDPVARIHPELATTHFRTLRPPLPESQLIGVQYACLRPDAAFVVTTPHFFAFHGTGAHAGSSYPGLIGPEIDHANPGPFSPPGLQLVGHSPARCKAGYTWSDSTYYVAPSGAGVWAAGTMGWVDALGDGLLQLGRTATTVHFVQTVTDNLLLDFAQGPAGQRHRPVPNLAQYAHDETTIRAVDD